MTTRASACVPEVTSRRPLFAKDPLSNGSIIGYTSFGYIGAVQATQ